MGGDATRYINRALAALENPSLLLTNSVYPGTIAFLAASHLLAPFLSWPNLFTYLMAFAHLGTGLALSWWLWRAFGWPTAAYGLAIWALTTTGLTRYFEDGTLAQLLSLTPLLLSLERYAARKYLASLFLLSLAFLFHPLSGFFGTTLLTLYTLLTPRHWRTKTLLLTTLAALVAPLLLRYRWTLVAGLSHPSTSEPLTNLIHSRFGPFVFLALVGLTLLTMRIRKPYPQERLLLLFFAISALLAFNDWLGLGFLTGRFQSYFVLSLSLLASFALAALVPLALPRPFLKMVFVLTLFLATGFTAFAHSATVYHYYESPSRYARLHRDEQQAIHWLKNNLPAESHLVSTTVNRHSEWIPILSGLTWTGLPEVDNFFQTGRDTSPYTHAVFFLHREKIPPSFSSYKPVYRNSGAVVLKLTSP
jgi:hypothetical protein